MRLAVWLVIGLAIYFSYGMHHSHIAIKAREAEAKAAVRPEVIWPESFGAFHLVSDPLKVFLRK